MRRAAALPHLAVLAAVVLGLPARALPPEDQAYVPPALEPAEPEPYPEGFWQGPAAAVDVLLVRPFQVVGLAGGAALLAATLPFTAPTRTTDDFVDALAEQARSTFERPLGDF